MSHLYIFDYSDCTINHIKTDDDIDNEKAKEILKKHGFKESECSYMISDEELEINDIEENNTNKIIYKTGDIRLRHLEKGTKFKLRAYNLISGKYDILSLRISYDSKCCNDCPLEDYDCSHMDCNVELVK